MSSMSSIVFSQMTLLFWVEWMILYAMIKIFRGKRGALNSRLCIQDIGWLLLTALLVSGVYYWLPIVWLPLLIMLNVYAFLLWLDALLFIQYRIEVNRQTISWFFTGTRGLVKGIPHLISGIKKYPWGIMVPVFFLWSTLGVMEAVKTDWLLIILSAYGYLALLITSRQLWHWGIALCISLSVYAGLSTLILDESLWNLLLMLVVIITIVLLVMGRNYHSAFFSTRSILANILLNDHFAADKNIVLSEPHKKMIPLPERTQRKSEYFAKCQGANIILITMESLGCYINPYTDQAAFSKVAKRFSDHSWLSLKHYSLCPNTTVASNQIYTGAYSNNPYNKDDSDFPGIAPRHLKVLKENGYKTLFLDSANLDLFSYYRLINRIGFDKVWGTSDIPCKGLKADYRLLNMVDEIVKEIDDQPFFLHLINDQTHMPYELVDKEKFSRHSNRFKSSGDKGLYLNVVEEVDSIIDQFLDKLGNTIDLSDTLIVFTGDHGESFGEYGYSFHSNSVISQQIQVPFMLSHPNLETKKIQHSCHFDLFPTFFDLLGIDYSYACYGSSIALQNREYSYFAHSATLKGNTPANFCWIKESETFWVDRLFNQTYRVDTDTQRKMTLKGKEKNYYNYLMGKFLKDNKLIS